MINESNVCKYKLSIVTVVFKNPNGLENTIKSIISQKNIGLEYIVVNGGDDVETDLVCNKYIEYIDHYIKEPDHGIYDAMNKGILSMNGVWGYFLNAGDVFYDENVLSNVDKYLVNSNNCLFGQYVTFEGEKKYINKNPELYLCKIMLPNHQTMIVRCDILRNNLFDLDFKIGADANQKIMINDLYSFVDMQIPVVIFDERGVSSNYKNIKLIKQRTSDILMLYKKKRLKLKCAVEMIIREWMKVLVVNLFTVKIMRKIRSKIKHAVIS